jgi:molecular chaperone GrpE
LAQAGGLFNPRPNDTLNYRKMYSILGQMERTTDNEHIKSSGEDDDAPTVLEAGPLTPEQITQLTDQAGKAEEFKQRMLREAADFENYRKRAARERQDAVTFANENLLQKLIPVLDTFEMALAAKVTDAAAAQSLRTGVQMVYNQLKSALADAGLEEIDAQGKVFDPNLHEAVSQQEQANVPEGQVTQQTRKGYKFRNRLLRPAGVVVAKKPAA